MDFTVEEMNLICMYDTSGRKALMAQIRESISDVDDEDMRELMRSTLTRLEGMSDADFTAIALAPDYGDDDDETEV
jgi:hypothetical protein